MSLYTIAPTDTFEPVSQLADLRIEESSNIDLLAMLGSTSPDTITGRLANDHVAFVAYLKDIPAAFGWMARGKAFIGELNHELVLPYRHRYLWNFRTLEPFRGLGIYPLLLQYIVSFEQDRACRFWIIHAPENEASLKGIQKAGFKYVGKLYNTGSATTIEATELAFQYHDFLEQADVKISVDEPVSCWNCSSPFLKKRKSECCCQAAAKECVGHNAGLATMHV